MITNHEKIIELLLKNLKENNLVLYNQISNLSFEDICKIIFKNYRLGHGLRLTDEGLLYMNDAFKAFSDNMPDFFKLKPKYLLFLDKTMKFPYYIDSRIFVHFDSEFNMFFKLAGSDLDFQMEITEKNLRLSKISA